MFWFAVIMFMRTIKTLKNASEIMLPERQPTKYVCCVICNFLHTLHIPLKKLQWQYVWWRFFFCLFVQVQKISTTSQRWGQLLTPLQHHPGSPCHAVIASGIVRLPNCTTNLWGSWTSEAQVSWPRLYSKVRSQHGLEPRFSRFDLGILNSIKLVVSIPSLYLGIETYF